MIRLLATDDQLTAEDGCPLTEDKAEEVLEMSSEESAVLKEQNERLVKANQRLSEMLSLMEKFRVLLIAMVNNCKCGSETNIRIKFNLLMEDYYEMNDQRKASAQESGHELIDATETLTSGQTFLSCPQLDINSVVDSLLTDKPLDQTEDNVRNVFKFGLFVNFRLSGALCDQ